MAVIEIAKIQVRRGREAQTGMPQLDSGEFGWAEDTEHLYIGKRIVDGAINDENTRILTEGDLENVFALLANTTTNITYYRYRNEAPWIHSSGTTVQTKLDTLVTLVDYGVVPVTTTTSTVVDITIEFQNAVADLFNNPTAPEDARRELLVPAGVYAISDAINLPPYSVIKGAGAGLTNLILYTTVTNMFRTVGIDNLGGEVTWEDGSGALTAQGRPHNIVLEGMTLHYQNSLTQLALVALDNASDCLIRNVVFQGTSTTYSDGIGVDIRGQGGSFALSRINDGFAQNIEIRDCEFHGMRIGVRATGTVVRPVINSNVFSDLHQGVSFYTTDSFPGPSDGLITKNRFHNIVAEGFFVGENPGTFRSNHLSSDNFYGYVGNGSGFNDFITTSTTFYPVYANAYTTSGSGVNVFVVNTVTYTAFKNIDVGKAYWYVTTSTVNGIYSQITGTVTMTPTTMEFHTTSTQGLVDYTDRVVTFGYIERSTGAINYQSAGNKTTNDVFARKVLSDQGPGEIVETINVLNVGTNGPYNLDATITIDPPSMQTGVQATANLVIDGGLHITEVIVTNPGYGYTEVPNVTITGLQGGGEAVNLRVNLANKYWYEPPVKGSVTINDYSNYNLDIAPGNSVSLARIPITGSDQQVNVQYQISSKALSRKGNILVNMAPDGYVGMSENYNYLANVALLNDLPLVPLAPSAVGVLYLSTSTPQNKVVDLIPIPPRNYYVIGSGIYEGQAAEIVSTGTAVVDGTTYYTVYTNSQPQFNYDTSSTTFSIGLTDDSQPSFGYTRNQLNNYVELTCINGSAISTATLEYQVNLQQL